MNTFKLTAEYLKNPGSAETQARRIEYHAFYTGQHDVECEACGWSLDEDYVSPEEQEELDANKGDANDRQG
jgi:hypothetical protein